MNTGNLRHLASGVRFHLLIAGLITVLAIALRVGNLGPTSLFVDDAWVGYVSRAGYGDIFRIGLTSVGFVAAMKVWFDIVGYSELAAQIPPFVIGCATPGLLYLILRTRIAVPFAAAAALLLATNGIHVTYSYHVKQYSFDTLWSVACIAFVVALARSGLRRRYVALFGVSAVVASLVSFTTVVPTLGASALIGLLLLDRSVTRTGRALIFHRLRDLAIDGSILTFPLVLMLGWYQFALAPNLTEGVRLFWDDHYVDLSTPGTAVGSLARRYSELTANTFNLGSEGTLIAVVTMIALLLVVLGAVRRPNPGLFCLATLMLGGVLSFLGRAPLGGGRTDSHLIVPLLVGVACGLHVIAEMIVTRTSRVQPLALRSVPRFVGLAAGVVIAAVLWNVGSPDVSDYRDNDAKKLVAVIDARRESDEAVALHRSHYAFGLYTERPSVPVSDGYHYQPKYPNDDLIFRLPWGLTDPAPHEVRLAQIAAEADGIWLLSSPIDGAAEIEVFDRILEDDLGFTLESEIEATGAVLQHWER